MSDEINNNLTSRLNNRVLVLGLDGATFDLIDPWIKEGKLPTLAKCIRLGTRARLQSTPLSNSAQAWSSFITGKNPGKHGIYDFFETRSDSYGVRFLNASFRKGKSLWRIVSDAGKQVVVMNVPISYPAEPVNGVLIPGLDSPGVDKDFAHPGGLMEEITSQVGPYILEAGIWGHIRRGRPDKALDGLLDMVRSRTATAKYLITKKPWDLFVVVFTATDKVQHHFWKYIDPERPEGRVLGPHSSSIFKIYEAIDKSIAQLLEAAPDASVIIMSDHGSGPSSRRTMYINQWLHKEGFLAFKSVDGGAKAAHFPPLVKLGSFKYKLLEKVNNEIKKLLPRKAKESLLRMFPGLRDKVDSVLFLPGIDWSRTRAYSRENHPAIFINTVGREAEGIVRPGEVYEALRDEIIAKLKTVRCPQTGASIVGKVFKREELFSGPETGKAPDIVFEWKDYLYVHRPSGPCARATFLETLDDRALVASENTARPSGIHRDEGIFVASGKHLCKGKSLSGVHIYDIAPTILYLLSIPIPQDMDGIVVEAAVEESYRSQVQIQKTDVAVSGGPSGSAESKQTHEFELAEAEAIEERLRGLGYID